MGNSNTTEVEKRQGEVTLTICSEPEMHQRELNQVCYQLISHDFEIVAITPFNVTPARIWVMDPSGRLSAMCSAKMIHATLEPTLVSKGKYKVKSDMPRTFFEARKWHEELAEHSLRVIAISPPSWLTQKYVFVQ